MKFFIKDFFSKCDQIRMKSLMENFIFCVVMFKEINFLYYYFFGQAYLQYGLYSLKKSIEVHFNRSNSLKSVIIQNFSGPYFPPLSPIARKYGPENL